MNADHASDRATTFARHSGRAPDPLPCDPLAPDGPDDRRILVTDRGLARIALVAIEAGMRCGRGALDAPLAWMQSPSPLFGDLPALEACLQLEGCVSATLLHAFDLDPHVDRDRLDALLCGRAGAAARWHGSGSASPTTIDAGCAEPGEVRHSSRRVARKVCARDAVPA